MDRAARLLAGLMLILALAAAAPVVARGDDLDGQTKAQLDATKEREEIRKLRDDQGFAGVLARFGPGITAFVAVVGLIGTLYKQISDSNFQRDKDREEREQERLRRFDERFSEMVENLGSDKADLRAGAAASIGNFLRADDPRFREQVFVLLLGAIRFPRGNVSDKIITRTFQQAARVVLPELREADPKFELDITDAWLQGVDLSGLSLARTDAADADLRHANFKAADLRRLHAPGADLRDANLVACNLQEARMEKARLAGARLGGSRLVSAVLKEADAVGAGFQGAKLQEAHLEGADLRKADFSGATLKGAYMTGATVDDACLGTVLKSPSWREAVWSAATRARLEQLAGA